jgi:dTDP-4-amino-4,6-dideoxygalactose transaminase
MPPATALRKADCAAPSALAVARPFMPHAEDIAPYLDQIDNARWYSNFGPLVRSLESRLAARFAAPTQVLTIANATLGLTLGLKALGVPEGALCAIPSWTFVATAHAVLQAGLVPWFVDVDPETWMLDPDHLQQRLAAAPGPVAAAIPVCAFGQALDWDSWTEFHERTGIAVLVDAAAAFDSLDRAPLPSVVSMHATKALGAGEGGFVVSEDPDFILQVQERSSFGFAGTREALSAGTNAKLSEYAAAVGLASLDRWPATRLRYAMAAQRLRMALVAESDVVFQRGWGTHWVSSTCVVGLPDGSADRIEARLNAAGVETRRWWGHGCHRSRAFAALPSDALPVTDRLAESTLGLPYFADIEASDIDRLADALRRALAEG